jgi:hypothetical protein
VTVRRWSADSTMAPTAAGGGHGRVCAVQPSPSGTSGSAVPGLIHWSWVAKRDSRMAAGASMQIQLMRGASAVTEATWARNSA